MPIEYAILLQVLIDRDVALTVELLILEKEYCQCLEAVEARLTRLRYTHPVEYGVLSRHLTASNTALGNYLIIVKFDTRDEKNLSLSINGK